MDAEGEFTALQSSPQWRHKVLQLFREPEAAFHQGFLVCITADGGAYLELIAKL
jgi:hypothetical protein